MSAYPAEKRDSHSSPESTLEVQHLKFEKEVGERLTAIETRSETYATREDLANIETRSETYATREDLANIETRSETYATRENLANAKLWGVVSVLGAFVSLVIALAVVVVRIFGQAN